MRFPSFILALLAALCLLLGPTAASAQSEAACGQYTAAYQQGAPGYTPFTSGATQYCAGCSVTCAGNERPQCMHGSDSGIAPLCANFAHCTCMKR